MKVRILAGVVAATLLLAGCSANQAGPTPQPDATSPAPTAASTPVATPTPDATATNGGSTQASGTVDCSKFEVEGVTTFIIWTQMMSGITEADGLKSLVMFGYTTDDMASLLDSLDQLKGIEGNSPGTPDEALADFRKMAAIIDAALAKGDKVTDADVAGIKDIFPNSDAWVAAQSSVTDSLTAACPDVQGSLS